MIGSLVLVNLRVLPTGSPVYDALGGYILPLAIPLLLFQSDLRKIIKESGRLLIIFIAAGATSVLGGIICGFLFRSALAEQTAGYVAVEVGADAGAERAERAEILRRAGHVEAAARGDLAFVHFEDLRGIEPQFVVEHVARRLAREVEVDVVREVHDRRAVGACEVGDLQ